MRKWPGIIAALVLLAGVAGCSTDGPGVAAVPADERTAAPDFDVPGLDGGRQRLADYRGTPVLINFWASYCVPCVREMPAIAAFADRQKTVRVLGLAVNEEPAASRAFARKLGVAFPFGVDRKAQVLSDFGGTGLPTTVLVGADGRVVTTFIGEIDAGELDDMVGLVGGS